MATEYVPMDTHRLGCDLSRYVTDNRNSYSVEVRWLADQADKFRDVVVRIKNGDKNQEDAIAIRDFRMAEINEEKAKAEDAVRVLEREAQMLFQQNDT